ncbi:MAG: cysteine hydrolase [Mycobacteriaceae bacterium]|nr:cysteine hydrolase [Mycobacteriaceae bacterium]
MNDMQHIFAADDSPWKVTEFARAEHDVHRLVEKYGAANCLFTRFIAPAKPSGEWVPYYKDWPFALKPADDPLWNVVPDLVPSVVNPTLDASTFGKWNADMAARLPKAQRILLCGVSTDCCVLSTALSALETGVQVLVVADACAGRSEEDHRRALDAIAVIYQPLARVTTLTELGI